MNTQSHIRNALFAALAATLLSSGLVAVTAPAFAQAPQGVQLQADEKKTIEVTEVNGLIPAITQATADMEDGKIKEVTIKLVGNLSHAVPGKIQAKGKIVIIGDLNNPDKRPILSKSSPSAYASLNSPVAFHGITFDHPGSSEMFNVLSDVEVADSEYRSKARGLFLKVDASKDSQPPNITLKNNVFKEGKILSVNNKLGELKFISNTFEGGEIESVYPAFISLERTESDPGKTLIQDNTFNAKSVEGTGAMIRIARPGVTVRRNRFAFMPDYGSKFTAIEFMNPSAKNLKLTDAEVTLNSIQTSIGIGNSSGEPIDPPASPDAAPPIRIHKNCFLDTKAILPKDGTVTKSDRVFELKDNCTEPKVVLDNPILKPDTVTTITTQEFDQLVQKSKEDDTSPKPPGPNPPGPNPPGPNPPIVVPPNNPPAPSPTTPPSSPGPANKIRAERHSGTSRVETSIELSKADYKDGALAVIVARADNHADSVSAIALANVIKAPILLTQSDTLHPKVAEELKRLKPKQVVIMGGPVAIHDKVATDIKAIAPTSRIAGANRADTAVLAAEDLFSRKAIKQVLVADGADWQPSLISGPAAVQVDGTTLLTNGNAMAPETEAFLKKHPTLPVTAIGSKARVAMPGKPAVDADSPSALSMAVAKKYFDKPTMAGMATTDDFADALTGGAHIAGKKGPLLLVPSKIPAEVAEWVKSAPTLTTINVYGGETRITADQVEALIP